MSCSAISNCIYKVYWHGRYRIFYLPVYHAKCSFKNFNELYCASECFLRNSSHREVTVMLVIVHLVQIYLIIYRRFVYHL